jgi:alpha-N-acetylglucosamine transferase
MILVIETQVYENYAWNPDGSIGTGSDAYWKAKGGSSYKIHGVPANVDLDEIVSIVRPQIEKDNDYIEESIICYGLEKDGWLSGFERAQLEYEGSIQYAEPSIDYSELVEA